jgi:hypothetical protein
LLILFLIDVGDAEETSDEMGKMGSLQEGLFSNCSELPHELSQLLPCFMFLAPA